MNVNYRGHQIRVTKTDDWSVELVELESGTLLPTKVTAPAAEELVVCVDRARQLIDLYLGPAPRRDN